MRCCTDPACLPGKHAKNKNSEAGSTSPPSNNLTRGVVPITATFHVPALTSLSFVYLKLNRGLPMSIMPIVLCCTSSARVASLVTISCMPVSVERSGSSC
jgi:hypothetical protein